MFPTPRGPARVVIRPTHREECLLDICREARRYRSVGGMSGDTCNSLALVTQKRPVVGLVRLLLSHERRSHSSRTRRSALAGTCAPSRSRSACPRRAGHCATMLRRSRATPELLERFRAPRAARSSSPAHRRYRDWQAPPSTRCRTIATSPPRHLGTPRQWRRLANRGSPAKFSRGWEI